MGRTGFYDNPTERQKWQKYLIDYSPDGLRVETEWPIQERGAIIEQKGEGPGSIFLIALDKPMTFRDYVLHTKPREGSVPGIYRDLTNMGCIEPFGQGGYILDNMVTCIWTQWSRTKLVGFRRGLPVSYTEHDPAHVASIKVTNGIVQNAYKFKNTEGSDISVVEMFLLEPLPWYRAPYAIETDALKSEHVSAYTDRMIVRSTYLSWKEKSPETLPPGHLTEDGEEYVLDSAIPLDEVKKFCDGSSEDPAIRFRCRLGAALFHVLPLDAAYHTGTFRPMRQEEAGRSVPYIVTKEDIEEAMGREEED